MTDKIVFSRACVRNPGAVEAYAAEQGLILHTDIDDILDMPDIDAVVLATPHSVHVQQIIQCAEANKPVFSEKPIALTLAEARKAVSACVEADVTLVIGTDRRFLPAMLRLRELVADGSIGRLIHIEGQYSNDTMSQGVSGDWRTSADEAPGAGMTGPGLYMLDSMINIAGPLASLSGQINRPFGDETPVDAVSLLLRFSSGVTGILGCVRGVQHYYRIAVFGERGRIEMNGFGTLHICLNGEEERRETYPGDFAVGPTLALFAEAVAGDKTFPVSPTDILETVAAFETAITSFSEPGVNDVPVIAKKEV